MIEGLETRPVAIIGGGFQGRRIALMWASQGRPVIVFDKVEAARDATKTYFQAEASAFALDGVAGELTVSDDLARSVKDAWLVIEAVPEVLNLKRTIFQELERHAPVDCILATNSSSYKSRDVSQDLSSQHRVCNIHYFRPPEVCAFV
ncbi:hypothetical protein RQP46_002081 [Phenoliferia psychrophenolica]